MKRYQIRTLRKVIEDERPVDGVDLHVHEEPTLEEVAGKYLGDTERFVDPRGFVIATGNSNYLEMQYAFSLRKLRRYVQTGLRRKHKTTKWPITRVPKD